MQALQIPIESLSELESLISERQWQTTDALAGVVAAFAAGHHSLIAELPWNQTIADTLYSRNTVVLHGISQGEIFFFSPLKPRPEDIGRRVKDHGPPHKVNRDGSFSMELSTFELALLLGGRVLVPSEVIELSGLGTAWQLEEPDDDDF